MPMIVIRDSPCLHLGHLLDGLHVGAEGLDWAILELWSFARDPELDALALSRLAEESPTGLSVSSRQLRTLADGLLQVVDGILVGHRGEPPHRSALDLRADAELVIEALDGEQWRIFARDPTLIGGLRSVYRDVRDLEPEVAIPPVHHHA